MRTLKTLFLAVAATVAMSANAQSASDGSSTSTYRPKNKFIIDARVGSVADGEKGGFGLGLGYQIGCVGGSWGALSADINFLEFAAPFKSPKDLDYVSAKAGPRYFTPFFANGKLRCYTNLALGYTCVIIPGLDDDHDYDSTRAGKYYDYDDYKYEEEKIANHAFGLTWGIGIQAFKWLSIGYSLQYETAFKTKNHFATISFAL